MDGVPPHPGGDHAVLETTMQAIVDHGHGLGSAKVGLTTKARRAQR